MNEVLSKVQRINNKHFGSGEAKPLRVKQKGWCSKVSVWMTPEMKERLLRKARVEGDGNTSRFLRSKIEGWLGETSR